MLRPQPINPIPEETAHVAHAAFPKGDIDLRLADEVGTLFTDETFAALFPSHGQPTLAPWRLALVTILQLAEGLSDRQAADAVRGRIDWKYLLRLDLDNAGFDASVLVEFRARLVEGDAERLLFDTLLGSPHTPTNQLGVDGRQLLEAVRSSAAPTWLREFLALETLRHAPRGHPCSSTSTPQATRACRARAPTTLYRRAPSGSPGPTLRGHASAADARPAG